MAARLREVRWPMLGVIAAVGVGLLLLGLRYAPRSSVAGAAGQTQGWVSAAPSPGLPAPAQGFQEDPTKTVGFQPASCRSSACDEDVEVKTAIDSVASSPGSVASLTVRVVAHVRLYSGDGSFDYTPAAFSFRGTNHRLYTPVTTDAFGATLVAGHLDQGQSASGTLVFDVPAGGGEIEINDGRTVFDWPVRS
jgi:hypothetical protein